MAKPALASQPDGLRFVHQTWPRRVVFGSGASTETARELAALGAGRVLVIHTPGRAPVAERIARDLGRAWAGSISGARQHVGVAEAAAAAERAKALRADWLLAVGGGAATGLAKAAALDVCLPVAAVPTTYSGSEMTAIWGLTRDGEKVNGRDERVRPRLVVYDPDLLAGFPPAAAAASALNAFAHCAEALYAADASPLVRLVAERGAAALARGLERLAVGEPAEAALLEGAWLGGDALGAAAMGLHHKLCHVLGGMCGLPHAEMHAVLLPYVLAFNAPAAPAALTRLVAAVGTGAAAGCAAWLRTISARLGLPRSLAAIGMPEAAVAPAAAAAAHAAYANPRAASAAEIETLLAAALKGDAPADVSAARGGH